LPHQYSNMLLLHFMFLLRNKWLQLDCPVATFPLTSLVFSAYPETVAGMGNINCPSLCFGYTASHETVIPDYAEECAYAQRWQSDLLGHSKHRRRPWTWAPIRSHLLLSTLSNYWVIGPSETHF
jgi:hypothetical protein